MRYIGKEESLAAIARARRDGPLNLLVPLRTAADDQTVLDAIDVIRVHPAVDGVGLVTTETGMVRVRLTTPVKFDDIQSATPADLAPEDLISGKAAPWQNNKSPDTDAVYVWLSRDQDGYEGIIAIPLPKLGPTPMVFASERLARDAAPVVQLAAEARGFAARLVKFTRGETVLTTFDPGAFSPGRPEPNG